MDAWSLTVCTSSAVWASLGAGSLDHLDASNKPCTKDTGRFSLEAQCLYVSFACSGWRSSEITRRDRCCDKISYNHYTESVNRGERTLAVVRSLVRVCLKLEMNDSCDGSFELD
jgi:hypothetical protein